MKFKELAEVVNDIQVQLAWFGATKGFIKRYTTLIEHLKGCYTFLDAIYPGFSETDVPKETLKLFKPVYDVYRRRVYENTYLREHRNLQPIHVE
jgi:hypothetical protein